MPSPTALHFEEFETGSTFRSAQSRTVVEEDLTVFARLSGDHHPIHTDDEYARASIFGRRIAHGPFGVAVAIGLSGTIPEFDGTALALTDITSWRFKSPIFIGDTLTLELTIAGKRLTRSGHAIIDRHMRLVAQDGRVVQEGEAGLMVARRSTGEI